MAGLLTVTGAMLFPMAGLGFLMWLSHLEDTLTRDVQRARRRPEPPPILAIPVRAVAPVVRPVVVPEQRVAPEVEAVEVAEVSAGT
jgi:hypothetical protein